MSRFDDLCRSWESPVDRAGPGAEVSFRIGDVADTLRETAGGAEATLWLEGAFSCVFLGRITPDSSDRPPPPDAYPPGHVAIVKLDPRPYPAQVAGGGPRQVGTVLWASALPHRSFSRARSLGIQWVSLESIREVSVVGRRVARWGMSMADKGGWQPIGW